MSQKKNNQILSKDKPLDPDVIYGIDLLYPLFEAYMKKRYLTVPDKSIIVTWHTFMQNHGIAFMKKIKKELVKK